MNDTLRLVVSAGGWAGFIASVVFNVLQHYQLKRTRAAQSSKEQAAPAFYNFDGTELPIRVSGKVHSVHGPMMDLYCFVTIVNSTQQPMKIKPLRLLLEGEEWPLDNFFFREKEKMPRYKKISLTGNNKEHYELHFMFPDDRYPQSTEGELWLCSDNRPEPFPVKLKF